MLDSCYLFMILLSLDSGVINMASTADSDNRYLIAYGVSGTLGCFVSEIESVVYDRGNRVLIRSERGVEEGTVLATSSTLGNFSGIQVDPGIILGLVEQLGLTGCCATEVEVLYEEARRLTREHALPLSVIDIELLHDPKTAIVHVLLFSPFDTSALQSMLAEQWSIRVIIHDTTNPDAIEAIADAGCQSCGVSSACGSEPCGTGGCSTNSCGSGAGTSKQFQQQWKNYFAELREGMERRRE